MSLPVFSTTEQSKSMAWHTDCYADQDSRCPFCFQRLALAYKPLNAKYRGHFYFGFKRQSTQFITVLLSFLLPFLLTDSAVKTLKRCHCYPECPECVLHCQVFLRLEHFSICYCSMLVLPSILALSYNSFFPDAHLPLNLAYLKKQNNWV